MKHISSLVIFLIASIYITFPLIFHLGDYITGYSDEFLLVWIFNWVHYALITNPLVIFSANIYYPFINSLAYSDIFITSSVISWIPVLITQQPVTAINFTLLTSLVGLGFSIYLLGYYLTKEYLAALLSGILVIFSPAVLSHYVHLQVLSIAWVPLAILFFIIFLDRRQSKYFILSLICFVLQTYNSFLPGYFILFSYLVFLVFYWVFQRNKLTKIISKRNVIYLIIAFALIIPIVIPYYQVSKTYNAIRDIREAVHLSIQPEDLLYTSQFSRLYENLRALPFNKSSQNNEFQAGFLGFIFTLLVIISIFYFKKHFSKKNLTLNALFTLGLVGLVMSLGPVLHLGRHTIHHPFLIPLPYSIFYYVFPGFQGFRNAARWEMLFVLMMAIVIAVVMHKLLKRTNKFKKIIIYFLLIFICIAEYNFPMAFHHAPQVKEFPKVYSWLATTPKDSKIIEMPIYVWYMHPYVFDENKREYYSTIHFRKMVNGASGYSPQPWQKMAAELLSDFPSEKTISLLKDIDVDYIIIHKSEYDRLAREKFKANDKVVANGDYVIEKLSTYNLQLVKQFDNDYVFKL